MPTLWTSHDAEAATGGRATRPFEASGVSIDTRTLKPGDLFVALKDQRDGHEFVAQALAKGAAAALVSRIPEGVSEAAPLLLVADVLSALEALGRSGRARATGRVIAVTGSVGKTSTKEMLRDVLASHGTVHASEASYNNHWGVPLTLARLPQSADFAVIEIGMSYPGEIAPLARMARPHAALITTVAAAHLAAFDGLEGIAREKASVFEGLEPGGVAVVPSGLGVSAILEAKARQHAQKLIRFGANPAAEYQLISAQTAQDATIVQARRGRKPLLFKVRAAGRHFAMNALAVLALSEAVGADPAIVACDIGQWTPPAGRGARERIYMDIVDEAQSFDLIDDAYNANPASMQAAFEVLAAATPRDGVGRVLKGRRVAILGDMLELGPQEAQLHAALAAHPALAQVDAVHCAGPLMHAFWLALPREKRGEWHDSAEQMALRAHHIADAGDVLLVKGSKGSRISLMVEALKKLGQAGAADAHGASRGKE